MEEREREIAELAARFGEPRRVDAIVRPFVDPLQNPNRTGEVCMVIRRPNGRLLLAIKAFYPRGAHRLPTGGIDHGERILDALVRETKEETGLDTEVRRFVAAISYHPEGSATKAPIFHTFAFLLDETGGELGALDEHEQIEEWIEVEPAELADVAARLEGIASAPSEDIGGDWADWGRFRAVVHRVVHKTLG